MAWELGGLMGPIAVGIAMAAWDPHGLAVVFIVLGIAVIAATLRRIPLAVIERAGG
jgi:hypothetical protein